MLQLQPNNSDIRFGCDGADCVSLCVSLELK